VIVASDTISGIDGSVEGYDRVVAHPVLARVHNPLGRECGCAPECWCQRTRWGRVLRWYLPRPRRRFVSLEWKQRRERRRAD
jgi:hypothetical protein